MKIVSAFVFAAAVIALTPAIASAQGPYVGVSLNGEVVRITHSEFDGLSSDGGGEAFGFALRAGTQVGSNWGVELEFARPSQIRNSEPGVVYPLASTIQFSFTATPVGAFGADTSLFPVPRSIETRDRHTTLSPVIWAEQQVGNRVSLVYLGGASFYRSTHDYETVFVGIRAPSSSRTILYGVRPVVGLESKIDLTDHLKLVPGIRLHAIEEGWLFRPAVGLNWSF